MTPQEKQKIIDQANALSENLEKAYLTAGSLLESFQGVGPFNNVLKRYCNQVRQKIESLRPGMNEFHNDITRIKPE